MEIRAAYITHDRVTYESSKPSLTIQSAKEECDINQILKRFAKTGLYEHVNQMEGKYADVADVGDFQTSADLVANATGVFESLPSGVRADFNNSPREFFDFASDPKNIDEMRDMGLVPPAEPLPDAEASSAPPLTDPPAKPAEVSPPSDTEPK